MTNKLYVLPLPAKEFLSYQYELNRTWKNKIKSQLLGINEPINKKK